MVTVLKHGVTIHSQTEGAIIQSAEVEEKQEESNLLGMVGGVTQVVKTWTHSVMHQFSVVGSGDLTLATGTAANASLSLISGGITNILSFKYAQKLKEPSQWTYSGNHYPNAA